MKRLLIAVVVTALGVSLDAFAEQKNVFCVETFLYKPTHSDDTNKSRCGNVCADRGDCNLKAFLADGWKIDESMAKNIPMTYPKPLSQDTFFSGVCECSGTQYVLSKAVKINNTDKNTALLEKEIVLLKKEIELLKKENEMLKQENGALKK